MPFTKLLPALILASSAVACTDESTVSEPLIVDGKTIDGRSVVELQKVEGATTIKLVIDLKSMSIAGERVQRLGASSLGCVTLFPTKQLSSADAEELGQTLAASVLVTSTEDSCNVVPGNSSIDGPFGIDGLGFGVIIGGELYPTAPGCKQLLSDNLGNVVNAIVEPAFANLDGLEAKLPSANLQSTGIVANTGEANLSNLQSQGLELTGRTCR